MSDPSGGVVTRSGSVRFATVDPCPGVAGGTAPLTTDTWLLRSGNGGDSWTEERIGADRGSFDMTTAPDALGYFVGDYAGLDFAGGGTRRGFKPFQVRANSANAANRTDAFATTASTGP